jgi:hypothetical protein
MNKDQIIQQLKRISELLDESNIHVDNHDWDNAGKTFGQAGQIQEQIKKNNPTVETLLAQSPGFKKQYEPLKAELLEKTDAITQTIETWRTQHTGKIADSKNTLDNISKFYKPSSTSYYIDREE